jgi:CRISPR type III-B/RAMP module-associated protein Cmr5
MALKWKDKDYGGKKDGNIVSGFPMLIRTNGLLAALAYAAELKESDGKATPKNTGEHTIACALLAHLKNEKIVEKATSPLELVGELSLGDASMLRRATAEALAFLSYLKRFVA